MTMTVEEAARSLVNRSRQGDQNATALIMETKKAADAGGEKAKIALKALSDYANSHPVGHEEPGVRMPSLQETVMLSNGEKLTDDRVAAMSQTFGSERQQKIFMYGVENFRDPIELAKTSTELLSDDERRALTLGRNVGAARNLQALQEPGARISDYSPAIGWELGE